MYVSEEICVPPMNSDKSVKEGTSGFFRRKKGNFSLLDDSGLVREGVPVNVDDVIIGKIIVKSSKSGEETRIDCSKVIKQGEDGIVDRVYTSYTPQGYKMVKVVIRKLRIPEMGDKFASRCAQKGVAGIMYKQEDMPFNSEGICPDLIINPHAIPSCCSA